MFMDTMTFGTQWSIPLRRVAAHRTLSNERPEPAGGGFVGLDQGRFILLKSA